MRFCPTSTTTVPTPGSPIGAMNLAAVTCVTCDQQANPGFALAKRPDRRSAHLGVDGLLCLDGDPVVWTASLSGGCPFALTPSAKPSHHIDYPVLIAALKKCFPQSTHSHRCPPALLVSAIG
jgi:hypothetical protein